MTKLTKRGDGSLRICYRPMQKNEFYGFNVENVLKALSSPNAPRTLLFHGPTGVGKTSAARYIGMLLNCLDSDGENPCLKCDNCVAILKGDRQLQNEINMADKTGIDDTRKEVNRITTPPFNKNQKKVLIMDEAQQMTDAAQQGWLKVLEEPPKWAYIIICTTNPSKFRTDFYNRLTTFQFHELNQDESLRFLKDIAKQEEMELTKEQALNIYETYGGKHRELINGLEKIRVGDDDFMGMLVDVDKSKESALNVLFNKIGSNSPDAWIILRYKELLTESGNGNNLKHKLTSYFSKIIFSEAEKRAEANLKVLNKAVVLARAVDEANDNSSTSILLKLLEYKGHLDEINGKKDNRLQEKS
jgi:DNA polymerase III gamma/tau subunit